MCRSCSRKTVGMILVLAIVASAACQRTEPRAAEDTLIASFGDKSVQAEMKKMRERAAADLDGIGDEASFQLVTLHVRKGDAYVTIDARLCSRAQAIAVARKVVSRL
jgi:hypothetical protein